MSYKLTYSTMFDPPPDMHSRFEAALKDVQASLGAKRALHINGEDVAAASYREKRSPINRDWILGSFAQASAADVDRAMQAARSAFPLWRAMPASQRIELLRRVAQLIEERRTDVDTRRRAPEARRHLGLANGGENEALAQVERGAGAHVHR